MVALVASAHLVSGSETFNLWSDNKCTSALGTNPVNIPLPDSATCFGAGTVSFVNSCTSDGKTEAVDCRIFQSSTTCSGTPDASYSTRGTAGACNPMTITSGDVKIACYVNSVKCGTTGELIDHVNSTTTVIADLADLVTYVQSHQVHPRKRFHKA